MAKHVLRVQEDGTIVEFDPAKGEKSERKGSLDEVVEIYYHNKAHPEGAGARDGDELREALVKHFKKEGLK
jgi:hypothetical protein